MGTSLKSISENQNNIVRDFDFAIDELESHLLSIRHDMSKVRTMTFKKIYDLHKQVEIAESLELGNRRLSVASATEIERERRHFTTKIQRQLNTLNNQIKIFNYKAHQKNLREIIDVQCVMSHNKLKSFFSVFVQCFTQTLCDIHQSYKNLNCLIYDNPTNDKMKQVLLELYGIKDILNPIQSELSIVEKIIHCMKFIIIAKNAMLYEIKKEYFTNHHTLILQQQQQLQPQAQVKFNIDIDKINDIVIIIARKLSIDEHMIEDIDRTNDEQIPHLAAQRVKNIFNKIINTQDLNQMFLSKNGKKPLCAMNVATAVLKHVFGIDNNQENDSYFT